MRKRPKKLTILHKVARDLKKNEKPADQLLQEIVELLPTAWQYPAIARARIRFDGLEYSTPGYAESRWAQAAPIETAHGRTGWIEVAYSEERPARAEGPFLAEERVLLDALANMLTVFFDRRAAEQGLRDSASRYRTLVESANDAIVLIEAQTQTIVAANRKACEMYQRPQEELVGMWLPSLTPDPTRAAERAREILREAPTSNFETIHLRKDGTRIRLLVNASVVDYDGKPAILAVMRDTTEWQQLQEQLRDAQRIEAVGRLAGGIAHDFNNILGILRGYSEMLLERMAEDEPNRKLIQQMAKAVDRAVALTQQLLAFSRKQELQPRELCLNDVVREIESMLRRLIGEDVALELKLQPSLGSVTADPAQLEQVIMNLAVNSRDAMPEGGTLRIATADVELHDCGSGAIAPPGAYVQLSVSDTGAGMDAETMRHMFEPFFTTKPKGKGTGLGLATVYGVVKQSGGGISATSEPGRGTTFHICLPRVNGPPAIALGRSSPLHASRGDETILLVEDEAHYRELIEGFLSRAGYTVLSAENPDRALDLVRTRAGKINLLLTDVVMPGLNGPQLAREFLTRHPNSLVLFMSGYSEDIVAERGVPPVDSSLLSKPFSQHTLLAAVRGVLDAPAGVGLRD